MKSVITKEEMKKREQLIPDLSLLMYRAGQAIYDEVDWYGKILIVVGTGNNAGDGYVLSKLLYDNGYDVTICLIKEKFTSLSKYYYEQIPNVNKIFYDECKFCDYDIIVDAIFGIGFKGEVSGIEQEIIEKINSSNKYVVAIDINSGLDANNGMTKYAIISDITVSLGYYKLGHFLNQAKDYIKKVTNNNINININNINNINNNINIDDCFLVEQQDLKKVFKERKNFSNKGDYGYVGIMGGSANYPGAAKLASLSQSALLSGCGVSKCIVPKSLTSSIQSLVLESTVIGFPENDQTMIYDQEALKKCLTNLKALSVGMGMGISKDGQLIIKYLLQEYKNALIIDADGLNNLQLLGINCLKNAKAKVILTPHLKEFSRLSDVGVETINQNPLYYSKKFALENNIILLLKGPTTIITDGKLSYLVNRGCPGMATAGSGDVLSGIISGICGFCDDLLLAASAASYINGLAGEIAQENSNPISMIASDTIKYIPQAITKIIQ